MATDPDPTPPTFASPAATSPTTAPPPIGTLAELRATGHEQRSLREEIRANLIAALADGRNPWPGLHGFDRTVIPQLERALIAGHDVVLLGERGQGKTRLLRTLSGLLDEWSPVITGSELNEHPYEPLTSETRARAARDGGRLPVAWRHRSERYVEKLSTPDTSVADLIGDVDPMRVAEGRRLGDPETIHYGLVPRSNRGIVALNELPDLAERIQVALLNVMEERDIQIRGYVLRLPLDVLVVASANPEDYTNRGRIITPLKDRFGAEIRTHYPLELSHEIAVIRQEARLTAEVPDVILEILARFTRALRSSSAVNQSSGVSARFAIAGAETVAAAARHRATVRGDEPVARLVDLESAAEVLGGKIEFESGEEGREDEILEHLLRTASAQTAREHFAGLDFAPLVDAFDGHRTTTGERVTAAEFLADLPDLEDSALYDEIVHRLSDTATGESIPQTDAGGSATGGTIGDLPAGPAAAGQGPDSAAGRSRVRSLGHRAGAIELALEGLYLARELSKESDDGQTIYG
ncbi:sigma 54-interacting transcriptional regulator [Citricoccus sp.]|uniref:sigma 54-interacting transcriptional regulator n=1 Tax=Citricoccus sp. TaxID=1978372 RepID=UPI0028BEE3F1|nr:sigma 54-interacting transcriptional regulator [Citricoccus sp.]